MAPDARGGVCVYRDATGAACLLAYRMLATRYVAVFYAEGRARVRVVGFSEVLDAVPVGAHCRHLALPIGDTLDDTLRAWVGALGAYLSDAPPREGKDSDRDPRDLDA